MAIYKLLQFSAFEPEAITAMTAAYEDALRTLQLVDRQDPLTEVVARKIIEVAQFGERDPSRLRARALDNLGMAPSSGDARLHDVKQPGSQANSG